MKSTFDPFFNRLGGVENLQVMLNLQNLTFHDSDTESDSCSFTLGWDKKVEIKVIKYNKTCPIYDMIQDYYFLISRGQTYPLHVENIFPVMCTILKGALGYDLTF